MVYDGVPTFNATLATMSDNLAAVIGQVSNSDQFLPFKGWWNSGWTDKYYQINASAINSNLSDEYLTHIKDVLLTQIPENGNNLAKAISTGYTITTKGGPVTLTPIYHNSSSGDLISYYYYPANTTPTVAEIKAMKKYTIGNMADPDECQSNHYAFHHQTFSLVFEDANGNVSYNFPEGYVINFMIANTDNGNGTLSLFDGVNNGQTQTKTIAKHPEYYGDGQLNTNAHARGLNGSDNAGIRIFPVDIDKEEADKMTIGEIANSIRVYVTKNGVDCDLEAPVGGIASKIGVKCNYEWCDEREDIDNKYKLVDGTPLFKNYVQGIFPVDGWYNYAKKEIDEYKAAMLP